MIVQDCPIEAGMSLDEVEGRLLILAGMRRVIADSADIAGWLGLGRTTEDLAAAADRLDAAMVVMRQARGALIVSASEDCAT